MARLQRFRLIEDVPRTGLARLVESIRSFWIGPVSTGSPDFERLFSAPPSRSGVIVTEHTALMYSAFWACVNAISTDVASLPLIHYKRDRDGGKTRYTDSKLYRLLHDEPNPEMTAITMRQTLTAHALAWGNGYAEIERDQLLRPLALWPVTPNRVAPYRTTSGSIAYLVRRADGGEDSVPAGDMLHIPGLGFDGIRGYSVVTLARESIGLGLGTERFGSTFFGNGSTFGGVISYAGPKPTELSDKNYRETLETRNQGIDNAHKLLALYNGATYTARGIPPNDAQFLETRLHQIEEMCRWFRMPPHKVQHLLRSTNNNIEHQAIEYVTDTLRPWLVRWEQELSRKCISPSERRIQFVEHLVDGVLRGDLASRYAAYAVGRQWGWLSADDICDRENMNPLPNGQGKMYLVPLNMTPADRINELITAQIEAKKTPPTNTNTGGPDLQTIQTNALAMVEAIRAALVEAEQRAEAHLARAVQAEDRAESLTADDTVLRAELEQERERERAAALDAAHEVGTLKSLLLEATEREATERAARDAAEVTARRAQSKHAKATAHITTAQAAQAAADAARQVSEGPP
jgi:HK97 family phage portal protein